MLREGATMTTEAWGQEYKPNQDWGHAWGTAPANFIVRHLMGIQPLEPGFAKAQIKPYPGWIKDAALNYQTLKGPFKLNFKNGEKEFVLGLEVPGNTRAEVLLPFSSEKARVRMNGRKIKAIYSEGYWRVPDVGPGKFLFKVYE